MRHEFAPPDTPYPIRLADGGGHRGTVFLSAVLNHPRIVVGDYSYASAFDPPADPSGWAARLAPYLFDFLPEQLDIGRFCQITDGVRFITASANHRHDGFSTFPFAVFGGGPMQDRASMPGPGPDTVVGNDVWIGQGARILPGARLGDGVIVGAGAVASGDVPPYATIVGNPARVLRLRFDSATIDRLLALRWWNWPIAHILRHEAAICGADIAALERADPYAESRQIR